MRDTPRTDALLASRTEPITAVKEFMRTLERELNDALARIPTWTLITDDPATLPPLDKYVIVYSRYGITSMMHRSRHGKGGWAWRSHGKTFAQSQITHWMPLPDAPEKEVECESRYPDRPATMKCLPDKTWRVTCGLCREETERVTYQEASIWLTQHLNKRHLGWDAVKEVAE